MKSGICRYLNIYKTRLGSQILYSKRWIGKLYTKSLMHMLKRITIYIYLPKTNTIFCSINLYMQTVRISVPCNHYIPLVSIEFEMSWDRGQRNYCFATYSRCASFSIIIFRGLM